MKATLNTQELQMMAQALDVAARRGAYGAAEMAAIGQLHNKLSQMIQQEQPETPKAPESPETPKEPDSKD